MFSHQKLPNEVAFFLFFIEKRKFFLEIVIFSWVLELLEIILAFSLKLYLVYSPPVTCWRVVVFCIFDKKRSRSRRCSCSSSRCSCRTRACKKGNYFPESFPWIFSNFNIWGEPVNTNSIIIISKGYHYVNNLGIVSNLYISSLLHYRLCLSWILAKGPIVAGEFRGNFPYSIDPEAHYPLRVLTGHNWGGTNKGFLFYSGHPCPFYP